MLKQTRSPLLETMLPPYVLGIGEYRKNRVSNRSSIKNKSPWNHRPSHSSQMLREAIAIQICIF